VIGIETLLISSSKNTRRTSTIEQNLTWPKKRAKIHKTNKNKLSTKKKNIQLIKNKYINPKSVHRFFKIQNTKNTINQKQIKHIPIRKSKPGLS
jgi:hypothetical protein